MKRRTKIFVSCLLATAMLIGMTANCFAANIFTVTKVEIIQPDNSVKTVDLAEDEVLVRQTVDALRIIGKLTDATGGKVSHGTATYLAYDAQVDVADSGVVLGNDSIEYIDQKVTDNNGDVTFIYRNRPGIAVNTTIKAFASGTDVDDPFDFTYTVVEDKDVIKIDSINEPIDEGTEIAVSFELSSTFKALNALTSVKLNNRELTTEEYTFSEGALTIVASVIAGLSADEYALTVTADGFYDTTKSAAIVINSTMVDVPEEEADEFIENINKAEVTTETVDGVTSVTLPAGGATNGITVTPKGDSAGKVDVNDTKVTLKDNVAFAKVDLDIAIKGSDKSTRKTVYMIPEGTVVSYGNLGLHTKEQGESYVDAFTYTEGMTEEEKATANNAFELYVTNETNRPAILEDVAVAISVLLNPAKAGELPHFDSVLDFDGKEVDGQKTMTLAEYRIYRLLMNGNDTVHTFTAVNETRANVRAANQTN